MTARSQVTAHREDGRRRRARRSSVPARATPWASTSGARCRKSCASSTLTSPCACSSCAARGTHFTYGLDLAADAGDARAAHHRREQPRLRAHEAAPAHPPDAERYRGARPLPQARPGGGARLVHRRRYRSPSPRVTSGTARGRRSSASVRRGWASSRTWARSSGCRVSSARATPASLAYTAGDFDSERALRMGLVNEVFESPEALLTAGAGHRSEDRGEPAARRPGRQAGDGVLRGQVHRGRAAPRGRVELGLLAVQRVIRPRRSRPSWSGGLRASRGDESWLKGYSRTDCSRARWPSSPAAAAASRTSASPSAS